MWVLLNIHIAVCHGEGVGVEHVATASAIGYDTHDTVALESDIIAVKGYKAKGKRLSTYQIESIEELEPIRFPEEPEEPDNQEELEPEEDLDPDAGKSEQQVRDELTGQLRLFDDEE